MRRLGISIYPARSTFEQDQAYLDLAHQYGYSRVFTSLLEINGDQTAVIKRFKQVIAYANTLGFKVIIDMNPRLFKQLGVSYDDLHFFDQLGVWGIRLDEGFTGMEEARMTRNPYGLKIEINMSAGTHYLDNIMTYSPQRDNLLGCHNFYPQRYTGLGTPFLIKWSRLFRKYGLHTAAFVNAPTATFGPWPVQDGLPTLEQDRDLPIAAQVKHLLLTDLIDDVIIGNAYAKEEDLKAAAEAFFAKRPSLNVILNQETTVLERQAILENVHLYRGDYSEYVLRDTQTRVKYRDEDFSAHDNHGTIKAGDLIIVNNDYGQYKGELQIARCEFANDGRRNVVGHLAPAEAFLLAYLQPWSTFELKQV